MRAESRYKFQSSYSPTPATRRSEVATLFFSLEEALLHTNGGRGRGRRREDVSPQEAFLHSHRGEGRPIQGALLHTNGEGEDGSILGLIHGHRGEDGSIQRDFLHTNGEGEDGSIQRALLHSHGEREDGSLLGGLIRSHRGEDRSIEGALLHAHRGEDGSIQEALLLSYGEGEDGSLEGGLIHVHRGEDKCLEALLHAHRGEDRSIQGALLHSYGEGEDGSLEGGLLHTHGGEDGSIQGLLHVHREEDGPLEGGLNHSHRGHRGEYRSLEGALLHAHRGGGDGSSLSSSSSFLFLLFAFVILSLARVGVGYDLGRTRDVTYLTNTTVNVARRQGLDDALRKYTFMALSRARSGVAYNVSLTPYLGRGVYAQAVRVRSGSLKRYGLVLDEFTIPQGTLAVAPGGPVLVLAYRRIFNFTLYTLPPGFSFAGPTVGIVAYLASNTTFDDLKFPEISLDSPLTPVQIRPPLTEPVPQKTAAYCAFFALNGSIALRNITTPPNVCTSNDVGDVAIVISSPITPTTESPPPPSLSQTPPPSPTISQKQPPSSPNKWKLIIAIVLGGVASLALVIGLVFGVKALVKKLKIASMERQGEDEEALQTALIGDSRAPTAAGVRTRPTLELDYSP